MFGIGNLFSAGASLLGGILGDKSANDRADQNVELQREFAQNGIRWKVEDAKAAGLHPLAALGAGGASFTPSAVVGDQTPGVAADVARSFIDGQNTKRAETATMTAHEREMQALALQRAGLQNRLLEAQINSEWASVMGQPPTPAMPASAGAIPAPIARGASPVSNRSGRVDLQASPAIASTPSNAGVEAGQNPFFKAHPLSPHSNILLPSQSAAEGLEQLPPGAAIGAYAAAAWDRFRHGPNTPPASNLAPPGYHWIWKPFRQAYTLEKIPSAARSPARRSNGASGSW